VYINDIEKYRKEGSTDEWYISKLLDKSISGLSPEQAYLEIDAIVEVLLKEKEWDIFLNHCQYILRLARLANTTEIPLKLGQNLHALQAKITEFDLVNHSEVKGLYAWFRI